eukprot:sb/3475822/
MSCSSIPSAIRHRSGELLLAGSRLQKITDYTNVFKRANERLLIALSNVTQGWLLQSNIQISSFHLTSFWNRTAPSLPDKMIDSSLGPSEKESCCEKGVISLPSTPPPPSECVKLLTSHTALR